MGAAARPARGRAEHADADAAARRERRRLHQLSRQCGAVLREAGGRGRRRRLPRLRLPELGREHARLDRRGARERTRCSKARSATPATSSIPTGRSTTSSTMSPWPRSWRRAGAHVLGLKDMAGLLKPAAARVLVKALREETGLPIHFHTHDTSGIAAATMLAAVEAGVDAVDAAMDALLGQHLAACLGSIVAALADNRARHRASIRPRSARSRSTGRRCAPSTPPSRASCRRRPRRSICTRCRAASSPTSRSRRGRWAWRRAGTRWRETYADVNQHVRRHRQGDAVLQGRRRHGADDGVAGPDARRCRGPRPRRRLPRSRSSRCCTAISASRRAAGPKALQKKVLKGETPLTERPGLACQPTDLEADAGQRCRRSSAGATIDDEDLRLPDVSQGLHRLPQAATATTGRCGAADAGLFLRHAARRGDLRRDREGQDAGIRLQAIGETDEDGRSGCSSNSTASRA